MANTLDYNAKLWTLGNDDILRTSPIKLRSIFLIPGTKGDGISFYQRNPQDAAVDDISGMNATVTNNETITDADTSTPPLFTNAAVGDWVYISTTSSGNNQGIWRYITGVDSGNNDYITVEKVNWGNLTNDTTEIYNLQVYNPNLCLVMQTDDFADTSKGDDGTAFDASITNSFRDFGDKGRWFQNLGMTGFASGSAIYVEIM